MRVKLWGVRGSLPAPLTPEALNERFADILNQFERVRAAGVNISADHFLKNLPHYSVGGYGGNTSCAEITHGKSRVLIDCGSGLRGFSDAIMASEPDTKNFHIYQTHYHWDHLIGIPFFMPIYMKGKTIHFYSVDDELEHSLRRMFAKPNFPVPYSVIQHQIQIHKVVPRQSFAVGELTLTPYKLDHPDPCWGLKVEGGNKAMAWCVDTECLRVSREDLGEDLPLYQNLDLMVFDAQYTFSEALEKRNWGHSAGPVGLDLSIREGIKRTVFIHHDPTASDAIIRQAEEQTRDYFDEVLRLRQAEGKGAPDLVWHFGREGEVFEL